MTFSPEWDVIYRSGAHLSVWPWSDFVSAVMRYARPWEPERFRVLELGCGAGANIPFFLWLGVDFSAVEGSPSIVATCMSDSRELTDKIKAGDFTRDIPFAGPFDLVVDRGSITHNPTDAIRRCLNSVAQILKPRGTFIRVDWFSTDHGDYRRGEPGRGRLHPHRIPRGTIRRPRASAFRRRGPPPRLVLNLRDRVPFPQSGDNFGAERRGQAGDVDDRGED